MQERFTVRSFVRADRERDASCPSELDGVIEKVQQNLPEPVRIAKQGVGNGGAQLGGEREISFRRPELKGADQFIDPGTELEGCFFESQFAGLDFREIEN